MKISIILGDITKIQVDCIVNATNKGMLTGGGVDGAIRRVAGPELHDECVKLLKEKIPKGLETGKTVMTLGYNLPAKYIIHTVGPMIPQQNPNLLKDCYTNCLDLAEKNNCNSISFPAISTGAYGCPIEKSAEIVKQVLENYSFKSIKEINLVLYS